MLGDDEGCWGILKMLGDTEDAERCWGMLSDAGRCRRMLGDAERYWRIWVLRDAGGC